MSDQGKWAKIWVSTLANPDLENLELHEWARWVRLILFMKAHGTNGKLVFDPPFRALQNVLRVESWDALCVVLRGCPGFTLFEPSPKPLHQPSQRKEDRHMLICRNWYKFQGDFSRERMQKLRQKRTVTSSVTSLSQSDGLRQEEKRRITSTSTSGASRSPLERGGAARETAEKVRSYEEAADNEICDPPKGMWEKVKRGET